MYYGDLWKSKNCPYCHSVTTCKLALHCLDNSVLKFSNCALRIELVFVFNRILGGFMADKNIHGSKAGIAHDSCDGVAKMQPVVIKKVLVVWLQ